MAEELELKLELTAEGADAIPRAPLFDDEPTVATQHSIYFDTPDHALSAAGLSLRIRTTGQSRIQTVKAISDASTGLFVRQEWEQPVQNDTPVLDDNSPIRELLGKDVDALAPIFQVSVKRTTWDLLKDDSQVEIAFDRGEVIAGESRLPIYEIEFERKSGSVDALFALAHAVDALVPLRIGVLSKSERGYRLLGGPPAAVKAGRIKLAADMSAASAFQAVAQACLKQFRLNEAILLDKRDPESLHQARVALRRLRSAISIYKSMLRDESVDRIADELRWLAATLGEARNLDVLIAREPVGPLLDALGRARDEAYASVESVLESKRSRRLMIDLAQWISFGGWTVDPANEIRDQPAKRFATQALSDLRNKVKKRGRDIADIGVEERHELRKSAKRLRYGAEFFGSLYDRKSGRRRYPPFIDALEELQDHLGVLNDIATAPHVLEHFGLNDLSGADQLLSQGKENKLIGKAARAHSSLVRAQRFWRHGD